MFWILSIIVIVAIILLLTYVFSVDEIEERQRRKRIDEREIKWQDKLKRQRQKSFHA